MENALWEMIVLGVHPIPLTKQAKVAQAPETLGDALGNALAPEILKRPTMTSLKIPSLHAQVLLRTFQRKVPFGASHLREKKTANLVISS